MRLGSRRVWRWKFSTGIVVPSVLLLLLTGTISVGFAIWSTNGSDARALERDAALVERGITGKLEEIANAQQSIAVWDDAAINVRRPDSKTWMDENLGTWMHDFYGFDAIAVISDTDTFVYTMLEGTSPAPQALSGFTAEFAPLIGELRSKLAAGALEQYAEGGTFPHVIDVLSIAGQPAAVSVAPIVAHSDEVIVAPGTEYFHVAVDYLDDAFAAAIHDLYQLENVGFAQAIARGEGFATYPIFDRNGRLITMFEWSPPRPGSEVLWQNLPFIGLSFLVAASFLTILTQRLWAAGAALEAERREARRQAMQDALTALPNRLQFEAHLTRDLREWRPAAPIALLMLDLDRFKHVNDTFGHEAGDSLICAVGQRIGELIGPADILARLGGDEFAIIHPCRQSDLGARELADHIVEAVAKPFKVNGSEVFVGASIGVAVADSDNHAPHDLIRKADIALYEAKARGRSRALLYDAAMGAQLQHQHQLEAELREALKYDDKLDVAFQPLVSPDGEIVGVEALARWTHPEMGQISPARFIPAAEASGLIDALGDFVLRRSCAFGARWPGRRIAVNISPLQLRHPGFPERLLDILLETGMRANDLELEITEGILLDHDGPAAETIKTLRRTGIRIALDDFGTGYSSLNYLKRYPVDCIKIDRSFVSQLAPDTSSAAIVRAMITLAHALDIEVTAEGVETHEQLTLLKAMGCNLFQGFLLAPPASQDVIEAKLERRTKSGAAA